MTWWWTAIVFLVLVGTLVAWWWLPKREADRLMPKTSDPKDRAEVEDNYRKTLSQLIGGAAVIAGAGLAYYQTQQTLRGQDEQSKRTVISQQVSKGFELLADKESPVKRLGGIYALEAIMNTSDQYHESVLETLCAFVRFSTEGRTGDGPPATEVQAALTVIKRRSDGPGRCILSGAQIPKAALNDANLYGADLSDANLSSAELLGIRLDGGASLVRSKLRTANLYSADLTGAILIEADVEAAQLISSKLNGANLFQANLKGVNLNGADLSGARLTSARLDGADLSDALNLKQEQLDEACGTETKLPRGLTIKSCQSR
jgi:hypothetical protein